jgi:hypothetical protein
MHVPSLLLCCSAHLVFNFNWVLEQSWKKLQAAHMVFADIFAELRTFQFRNSAHRLQLQICVVILIYFEVNIEE